MNFPRSPLAQNNRLIDAVCSGLLNRDREQLEAKAVAEIIRQINPREAGNMPGSDK